MMLFEPILLRVDRCLAEFGIWLRDHGQLIRRTQWIVVCIYVCLLAVPALLPLPDGKARILGNITIFAQFIFWGIWWPAVLISMLLVGRLWCGILCPEGSLSEAASDRGLGHALPSWIKWKGWPFAAFALTTIYGQLVSVYQYPKPAVLILGGSTFAAIVIGYLYGRNKRVWCRYLCPVNGVFGLLAKLAPVHFKVDAGAWRNWHKPRGTRAHVANCAPLVVLPSMESSSPCHMCGRCAGFRDAIVLARRSPNEEIVNIAGKKSDPWETLLIVFGLIGIAGGAFHWSASPLLVSAKQSIAEWLVAHGVIWPLDPILPWWILTNYPDQNDMLSPLDGALIIAYIVTMAIVIGSGIIAGLALSVRIAGQWQTRRLHHLAQSLIPVAACGVILGLSSLTLTMLKNEGVPMGFAPILRGSMLACSAAWALLLASRITRNWCPGPWRRIAVLLPAGIAIAIPTLCWASLFWRFKII